MDNSGLPDSLLGVLDCPAVDELLATLSDEIIDLIALGPIGFGGLFNFRRRINGCPGFGVEIKSGSYDNQLFWPGSSPCEKGGKSSIH